MERDLDECKAVFGIEPDDVRENVEATLAYYGGWELTPAAEGQRGPGAASVRLGGRHAEGGAAAEGQKRILFVNGDVDPWSVLAVQEGTVDHPNVVVPGASHHFWTHAVKDSDGPEVHKVRETIYETVSGWLGVDGGTALPKPLVPGAGGAAHETE